MTGVLKRRQPCEETETQGEGYVQMDTEIRVMYLQGEELLSLVEAGINKNGLSSSGFNESMALPMP